VTANLIIAEVWFLLARIQQNLEWVAYLIRRQLEVVSLIGNQVAEFHREHTGSLCNDQGEIPELKVDIVGALEVVVHRNLLFGVGLAIL
jgi:hypothetical protein